MIAEQGRIVSCEGQLAWVEAASRRDCARCAEGRGCGGGLLGRWLGNRLHRVRVSNPEEYPEGSWVEIALDERQLLLAALLMYLPPLLGLLAGAFIGARLLVVAEAFVVLIALFGFLLGLWPARWLSRGHRGAALATPVVVRRLPTTPPGCPVGRQVSA